MITARQELAPVDGGESWGRGERFGFAPLPDGRFYCYAAANCPPGQLSPGSELAEVRRRFSDWHAPIPRLLAATSEDAVLRNDVYDLPPLSTFVAGRVVLLGDAAHAMTPDLGQGACQALEDAVVLADALDTERDVDAALAVYDRRRRPRTQAIGRRSRRIGAASQWSWPPAAAVRNLTMRMIPTAVTMRSLASIVDWDGRG